jgi:hypothetical protein
MRFKDIPDISHGEGITGVTEGCVIDMSSILHRILVLTFLQGQW